MYPSSIKQRTRAFYKLTVPRPKAALKIVKHFSIKPFAIAILTKALGKILSDNFIPILGGQIYIKFNYLSQMCSISVISNLSIMNPFRKSNKY